MMMRSAIFSPSSLKNMGLNGSMLLRNKTFNGFAEPPLPVLSCETTTTTPPHPHLVLPLKEEFSRLPRIHPQMKHTSKSRNQQPRNNTWHGHRQLRLLFLPRDLTLPNFSWLGLPVMNGRRLQLLDHLERAWILEARFIRAIQHRPVNSDNLCKIVQGSSGGNCNMRLRWDQPRELVLWFCTLRYSNGLEKSFQGS